MTRLAAIIGSLNIAAVLWVLWCCRHGVTTHPQQWSHYRRDDIPVKGRAKWIQQQMRRKQGYE